MTSKDLIPGITSDRRDQPILVRWTPGANEGHKSPTPIIPPCHQASKSGEELLEQPSAASEQYDSIVDGVKELEIHATHSVLHAPIQRIPNEILGIILSFVPNSFSKCHAMTNARLVCQKWNAVAISTPDIWTEITLEGDDYVQRWSEPSIARWMVRSQNLPLNVCLSIGYHWPVWPEGSSGTRVRMPLALLSATRRWRELKIYRPDKLPISHVFKEDESPRALVRLQMTGYEYRNERVAQNWYANKRKDDAKLLPSLKELKLMECNMLGVPRLLTASLTSIELSSVSLSVPDYGALSQDTPNVKTLTFRAVWFERGHTLPSTQFCHRSLKTLIYRSDCQCYVGDGFSSNAHALIWKLLSSSDHSVHLYINHGNGPWKNMHSGVLSDQPGIEHLTFEESLPQHTSLGFEPERYEKSFPIITVWSWLKLFSRIETLTIARPKVNLAEEGLDDDDVAQMWFAEISTWILHCLQLRVVPVRILDIRNATINARVLLQHLVDPMNETMQEYEIAAGTRLLISGSRVEQLPQDHWGTLDPQTLRRLVEGILDKDAC
jgi:hypothetical protein